MSASIIHREYGLAKHAAMTKDFAAFETAFRRLKTLDRQGELSSTDLLVVRLVALARDGQKNEFASGLRELRSHHPSGPSKLKAMLLQCPEARYPTFQGFIQNHFDSGSEAKSQRKISAKVATVAAAAVVLLGVVGATAFSVGRGGERSGSTATTSSMSESHQAVIDSIGMVVLRAEVLLEDGTTGFIPASSGTAFAVSRDGLLVTNRHVVEGGPALLDEYDDVIGWDIVFIQDGAQPLELPAKIIQQSSYADIALLRVDHMFATTVPLSKHYEQAERIRAYGFPGVAQELAELLSGRETSVRLKRWLRDLEVGSGATTVAYFGASNLTPTLTEGIIGAVRNTESGRVIQFDAAISGGNSGGPLVNERGEIIGVVTWKHGQEHGYSLAIAVETVFEEFRHIAGIDWPDSFTP